MSTELGAMGEKEAWSRSGGVEGSDVATGAYPLENF